MLLKDIPKANANCVVCGKPYYVCHRCLELKYRGTYVWKLDCNSQNCFRLKTVLDEYDKGFADRVDVLDTVAYITQYEPMPELISPYKEIYDRVVNGAVVGAEEMSKEDVSENNKEEIKTEINDTVWTDDVSEVIEDSIITTKVSVTDYQSKNKPYIGKKKHGKRYAKQ